MEVFCPPQEIKVHSNGMICYDDLILPTMCWIGAGRILLTIGCFKVGDVVAIAPCKYCGTNLL